MESTGGSSGSTTTAAAMPSPSVAADNCKVFCSSLFKASNFEFDASISEEEKRFYLKAYPTVDVVRERKTHCTVCKIHIGTAPVQENGIKMHPILRVTHCNKCHDFYNSGEFSKGEDGSELYCRWCGQGGEVYCCSSCPYVFCKSCIVKNLSRGVVADIEQNENWNCFSCAPKILWPLRAQHWALMNYIEQQKKELYALNLSESELKINLGKDRSRCCRLAKAKCGNMSDSMESLDSVASKRSHSSSFSSKKPTKHSGTPSPQHGNAAKRAKNNDEVVCTPDLLSMLEPDCQITVPQKPTRPMGTPAASIPKIMSIQQPQSGGYGSMHSTPKNSAPPPLVLRNTAIKLRPAVAPPVVRRTIIGPRTPNPGGNGTPVYHTINGYRIDLNSAAQQETFRLPNGKLIQVKRQGPPAPQTANASINSWQQMTSPQQQRVIPQTIASRPVQITPHPYSISVQQQQGQHPQVVRYHNNIIGTTTINPVPHNGTTIQVVNGQISSAPQVQTQQQQPAQQSGPVRPVMVRHVFPDNTVGHARSGLQDQVFNAMEICTHLTNKVQTLTNSNAYKQARNFLEVKELYIHLSYLLTYAIGRFKSLQDKCLGDMRTLGFGNDADCLENGQLAADKQASDDEDNEIEIVEPKTDLITLDSDDDEPAASNPIKSQQPFAQLKSQLEYNPNIKIKQGTSPVPVTPTVRPILPKPTAPATLNTPLMEDNMDLMSMAQSFLASMLEVEIQEGPVNSPGSDSSGQKKQPRKKLTNKPNPTLLKQKALMQRERLEEMKRNDQKLKMKCSVELKKAEEEFPYAKAMLEARTTDQEDMEENEEDKEDVSIVTEANEAEDNKANEEEDKANEEEDNKSNEEKDNKANKEEDNKANEQEDKANEEAEDKEANEAEVKANSKEVTENEAININSSTEEKAAATTENDSSENATVAQKEDGKISLKIIEPANASKAAEIIDKEIDQNDSSTEKDKSEENMLQMADKSAEDIEQEQEENEDKSNDGKDKEAHKKLENTDILPTEECQDIAKSMNNSEEKNVEENSTNDLKNNENEASKMETDTDEDMPLAALAKDTLMETDVEEESALLQQTDIAAELDPEANESKSQSNELESEAGAEVETEEKVEEILPQEDNSEIISDKEIKNIEEQPPAPPPPVDTEEKNVNETSQPETTDNMLLSPSILDSEHPSIPEKESHKEQAAVDLPVSEENSNRSKELPTPMEGVETIETPVTDCKDETNVSTSNGNV